MHNTPFYFLSSGVEIPVLQLGRLIVRKTYTSSMNMLIRDTPCDHCDHQLSNVSSHVYGSNIFRYSSNLLLSIHVAVHNGFPLRSLERFLWCAACYVAEMSWGDQFVYSVDTCL